jgi:hypothetical protein
LPIPDEAPVIRAACFILVFFNIPDISTSIVSKSFL